VASNVNKRVWIFKVRKDVLARGDDQASWYVGWYDLQGRRHSESCGAGSAGKNKADKRVRRLQSELDMGVHLPRSKVLWTDFVAQFETEVLSGLEPTTRLAYQSSLDTFARHTGVNRVEPIDTRMIDAFIARRRRDPGRKPGSTVSPATLAKDLRMIKAALTRAVDWGYLPTMPKVRSVRQPEKIPRFVTEADFGVLYTTACALAKQPSLPDQPYAAADWWQALIVTAFMTGLRIKELLQLRREDLDLEAGTIITRAEDNKGKRDARLPIHPIVVEHLKKLVGADKPLHWPRHPRSLWAEWGRIQRAAGIHLHCSADHQHTPACHVYGFHDFRRAFATHNAPNLNPETLQRLMRHRSFTTTMGYINLSSQMNQASDSFLVPEILRSQSAAAKPKPNAGTPQKEAKKKGP